MKTIAVTAESIIEDEDLRQNVKALVGDRGNLSEITGEIETSSTMIYPAVMFETEHGVTYIPADCEIEVRVRD